MLLIEKLPPFGNERKPRYLLLNNFGLAIGVVAPQQGHAYAQVESLWEAQAPIREKAHRFRIRANIDGARLTVAESRFPGRHRLAMLVPR